MTPATYSTDEVAVLTGLSRRQTDMLDRTGVAPATHARSRGTGQPRRYSAADLLIVAAVARLRRLGLDLRQCTDAAETIRAHGNLGGNSVLVVTAAGAQIIDVCATGDCFAVLHLGTLVQQVETLGRAVNGDENLRPRHPVAMEPGGPSALRGRHAPMNPEGFPLGDRMVETLGADRTGAADH